jgi:hypothetical protein
MTEQFDPTANDPAAEAAIGRLTAGSGPTLHDALHDAFERAQRQSNGSGVKDVVSIQVSGDSPLSEYRVVLKSQS